MEIGKRIKWRMDIWEFEEYIQIWIFNNARNLGSIRDGH